jgi:AcrR family transcriptional regulator
MRSTPASDRASGPASGPAPEPVDDRTARSRIRDAAIGVIAAEGAAGSTVRAVAADAGVSPGLVIHHFGSKEGLRRACDEHVVELVRVHKTAAASQGPGLDPVAALRAQVDGPPLLAYLARRLVEGSDEVTALVDQIARDAVGYLEEGQRSGMLRPLDDPPAVAKLLTIWSLGALVLNPHVSRLLGGDLTGDPDEMAGYLAPALEVLGRGVFTDAAAQRFDDAFAPLLEGDAPSHDDPTTQEERR